MVLIGAAAAGERRRVYEAAVLKTLGASRGRILASFALRAALIGAAAGLVAIVAGGVAGWWVTRFVMEGDFRFEPVTALAHRRRRRAREPRSPASASRCGRWRRRRRGCCARRGADAAVIASRGGVTNLRIFVILHPASGRGHRLKPGARVTDMEQRTLRAPSGGNG